MVHTLEIEEDTRDWLEEQFDGLKQAFVVGKVSRSVGDALKGALSHPVGYLSVIGGVIIALHTIPGIRDVVIEFEKKQAEATGEILEIYVKNTWRSVSQSSAARTEDERQMYEGWINSLWNAVRGYFVF